MRQPVIKRESTTVSFAHAPAWDKKRLHCCAICACASLTPPLCVLCTCASLGLEENPQLCSLHMRQPAKRGSSQLCALHSAHAPAWDKKRNHNCALCACASQLKEEVHNCALLVLHNTHAIRQEKMEINSSSLCTRASLAFCFPFLVKYQNVLTG
jgi:hypothetical protein